MDDPMVVAFDVLGVLFVMWLFRLVQRDRLYVGYAVIFVVDGRAGLTPADRDIAERLRRHPRVWLAVNKTEGMAADSALAEFHELGIGAPVGHAGRHRAQAPQVCGVGSSGSSSAVVRIAARNVYEPSPRESSIVFLPCQPMPAARA